MELNEIIGNTKPKKPVKLFENKIACLIVGLTGGTAVVLSAIAFPFVLPALRRFCLPYVPATNKQVENVLQALKGQSGNLLDIGSGDGRIVIAAAKEGFKSDGVELNLWLVLYSKFNAFKSGLSKSTMFYHKDLWKFPIKPYKNVVIFGVEQMMPELDKKFSIELSDACVVACRFPLPSREPVKVIGTGVDTVWLYHINKKYSS